jgi:hypothetical protein
MFQLPDSTTKSSEGMGVWLTILKITLETISYIGPSFVLAHSGVHLKQGERIRFPKETDGNLNKYTGTCIAIHYLMVVSNIHYNCTSYRILKLLRR